MLLQQVFRVMRRVDGRPSNRVHRSSWLAALQRVKFDQHFPFKLIHTPAGRRSSEGWPGEAIPVCAAAAPAGAWRRAGKARGMQLLLCSAASFMLAAWWPYLAEVSQSSFSMKLLLQTQFGLLNCQFCCIFQHVKLPLTGEHQAAHQAWGDAGSQKGQGLHRCGGAATPRHDLGRQAGETSLTEGKHVECVLCNSGSGD